MPYQSRMEPKVSTRFETTPTAFAEASNEPINVRIAFILTLIP